MPSDEQISISKLRIGIAAERLDYADEILKIGDYKTVANRSYYAVFSAMRAVLALDGFDSKETFGNNRRVQETLSENGNFTKP